MTYYEHLPFRENIPAYVLGSLDAEEVSALEAHLRRCESCRNELAAYRATSDNLLLSLPPQEPSAALRKRLEKRLSGAQKTVRSRVNWSFGRVAVGIAILLLLALNIFSISQVQALQRQQTQLMEQMQDGQAALAMLSYSNTQTFPINQDSVRGSLLLDKEYNNAVLILRGLPPIMADQTYQIWLIAPNGERINAGVLRPQMSQPFVSEAINAAQTFSNYVGMDMTIEPAGGSEHPTGMQVFQVDF
jgi:anti-sigma-K factor RskA